MPGDTSPDLKIIIVGICDVTKKDPASKIIALVPIISEKSWLGDWHETGCHGHGVEAMSEAVNLSGNNTGLGPGRLEQQKAKTYD